MSIEVKVGQVYKERGEHRHVKVISLDGAPERVTIQTCLRNGALVALPPTRAKISRFDGSGYQLISST